jgi:molybdate transport system substrate-binding protein
VRPRAGRRMTGAIAILAATSLASCIREVPPTIASTTSPTPERRELVVYAPAPLEQAFEELAGDFEFAHEGVDVALAFGPSDQLAARLEDGDARDVFVSETPESMDAAAMSPGVEEPRPFATNALVVILPPGNPADVDDFTDLGEPGVDLVLAENDVPIGRDSRVALAGGGILVEALRNVVIEAPNVEAVVETVRLGAVDAGIAYTSYVSVAADNDLPSVGIADGDNVETVYSISVLSTASDPELARDFIALLSTAGGKAVLEDYGFETVD